MGMLSFRNRYQGGAQLAPPAPLPEVEAVLQVVKEMAAEQPKEEVILIKEKPSLTCDICGQVFTAPIALAGHKRKHK